MVKVSSVTWYRNLIQRDHETQEHIFYTWVLQAEQKQIYTDENEKLKNWRSSSVITF